MRIQRRSLVGTPLTNAWLDGQAEATELFPGRPGDLEAYRAKAAEIDSRFGADERRRSATYLSGGGPDAARRLDAFVERGGFMVTTGQQPGLFGGPLFGLYKALTAGALARRIESALERPVLPVFWIGSEDHSWDEVRSTWVLDTENELHELALPPREGQATPPIHGIPMGRAVSEQVDRLLSLNPETDFSPRWRSLLDEAYRPELSLADGFRTVMETLLSESGVFLVQAHDPGLKSDSLPYLLREMEEAEEREAALAERASHIGEAGFAPQVPILDDATNLFLEGPGGRERLFRDSDGLRLRGSGTRLTPADVEARARDEPSVLSPNVLLRPVIESALLPTLSYVAGPSEAAYLPQTEPVFAAHGIGQPVVHPRVALVLLEGKVDKVLTKFGLDVEDLAQPHHELAGKLLLDDVPGPIQAGLTELRRAIGEGAGRLEGAIAELDPTLKGPVQAFRSQSFELLSDIERKVVQGLKRENEIALSQVDKAQRHLFPMGRPQERIFNPFYYLIRYDRAFLDQLREHAAAAVLP